MPETTGLTATASAPSRVTVCRDCCCGTVKVPGDHAAQTARRRSAVPVRVSACLDVCEQADAIVVQPSAEGRRAGARLKLKRLAGRGILSEPERGLFTQPRP